MEDMLKEELSKPRDQRYDQNFVQLLMQYNLFLTQITEDSYYVFFKGMDQLVEIIADCANLDVVYLVLELLMNYLSVDKKTISDILMTHSPVTLMKLLFAVRMWLLNVNYANDQLLPATQLMKLERE